MAADRDMTDQVQPLVLDLDALRSELELIAKLGPEYPDQAWLEGERQKFVGHVGIFHERVRVAFPAPAGK
jgi:hypothetical protein